jgi:hypothetical protein
MCIFATKNANKSFSFIWTFSSNMTKLLAIMTFYHNVFLGPISNGCQFLNIIKCYSFAILRVILYIFFLIFWWYDADFFFLIFLIFLGIWVWYFAIILRNIINRWVFIWLSRTLFILFYINFFLFFTIFLAKIFISS